MKDIFILEGNFNICLGLGNDEFSN